MGDNLVAGVFGHVEGFTDSSDSVSSVGVSCHVLDWVSAGFFFGGERGEGRVKNGVGSLHRLIEHRFPDGCIHTSTSDSDEASSSNRDEFQ